MLGQSYEDLRTVRSTDENGNENTTVHNTLSEAAKALDLVRDDEEWERCLGDSAFEQMPFQIRALFVLMITQCSPGLYEKFKREMAHDYVHRTGDEELQGGPKKKHRLYLNAVVFSKAAMLRKVVPLVIPHRMS
ncbi:hypothetical protein L596_011739 [Steinernema carpocapsae]|uniref:Uncharacterized protein n=1 Tax=Steinernema carpocapsae TaxID=34508 RepID=A0A4U5NV89_STECR|nr:hypothetical protein L596_011739 [Steinernema carpocapsae]